MIITYLVGIATIVGLIAYMFGFNYIRIKVFKDHITDFWDYTLMPFVAIIAVMVILLIPFVIGHSVMGQ